MLVKSDEELMPKEEQRLDNVKGINEVFIKRLTKIHLEQ